MSKGAGLALGLIALLVGGAGGYLLRDVQLRRPQERVQQLEVSKVSQAADYERRLADCRKRLADLEAERNNLAELLQKTGTMK